MRTNVVVVFLLFCIAVVHFPEQEVRALVPDEAQPAQGYVDRAVPAQAQEGHRGGADA